jgi:translation initiation factor IF-2
MANGIMLEEFGGDILAVEISARQNTNLDKLLDAILLQAEMLELKANKGRKAVGMILESRIDRGRGGMASIIVQHGTLRDGDIFVAGASFGKIRAMYDENGTRRPCAEPGTPIEIVGFDSSPEPGDVLSVVDTEQKAREIAKYRGDLVRAKTLQVATKTVDQLILGQTEAVKSLNLLVKADVYGSLGALVASLEFISHPEIKVNIVEQGIGVISESDVDYAKTTHAIIIGFNVNVSAAAKDSAKDNGIKILMHDVIYRVTEQVKTIMGTMLSPIVVENYIGTADVRKLFSISRFGTIAGCYVTTGYIKRADSKIKVMRNGKNVFEGKIRSMKHEKEEIKDSRQGHECGILAEGFNDFREGDQIECYEIVIKARSVD